MLVGFSTPATLSTTRGGGSLRAFRRAESRGRSLRGVGGTLGALGLIGGSLGVAGGVPGRPQGVFGEGPGGTENTEGFFRVSRGGPGAPLG